MCLAEREGFEPSMGDKAHTPLAGERLQPLGHLSGKNVLSSYRTVLKHGRRKAAKNTEHPWMRKPLK